MPSDFTVELEEGTTSIQHIREMVSVHLQQLSKPMNNIEANCWCASDNSYSKHKQVCLCDFNTEQNQQLQEELTPATLQAVPR